MPGVDFLLPQDEVVSRRLPVTETARGTHIVHGKRIFRAGTFKDSKGALHTWTVEQLDQVVANFNHLRQNNLLAGVPLRVDHTFSARDVVGWISDLKREGEFLIADLHFTESSAYSKWDTGTFEPVSSELAPYETNNGDIYYPTLIGVAFVDIPAVEGLYRASGVSTERVTAVFVKPSMLDSKTGNVYERAQEDHMPKIASANSPINVDLANLTTAELAERALNHSAPAAEPVVAEVPAAESGSGEVAATSPGGEVSEAPAGAEGAPAEAPAAAAGAEGETPAAPEGEQPAAETPAAPEGEQPAADAPAAPEGEQPAAEAPAAPEGEQPIPVTEPRPGAVHSAAQPSLMTFRVGGVQISDPELVQAHIDSLEAFQSSTVHGQRKEFVAGLVRDNKILAGQAENLTELALSMDVSQYAKFVASYEAAGANPLMGTHGRSGAEATPLADGQTIEKLQDELAVHSQIIERHKMTGKSQEWIEQTESFRRFTELNTQLNG